ncbi:hypothetical protein L195_g060747 [Trifolium pratense]|uniref:Uncharacterized protein n=1 Tax=Trifolium pratense TaxID=57577 RepID=A0A2K3K5T3_TRIPR|nr:hypothetical protein L195_g060747 [Trifolium pratense]
MQKSVAGDRKEEAENEVEEKGEQKAEAFLFVEFTAFK